MLMHRLIVVLILLPVLAPELSSGLEARNTTDWDQVKRLKPGSAIEVLLNDGRYLRGSFLSASDVGLEISIVDSQDPQFSFTHDLDRTNIRRVVQVHGRHLPDAKRWMITAAVGGGLIGLAGGTIADGLQRHELSLVDGRIWRGVRGIFCFVRGAGGGGRGGGGEVQPAYGESRSKTCRQTRPRRKTKADQVRGRGADEN
jgi:hypothetical protein